MPVGIAILLDVVDQFRAVHDRMVSTESRCALDQREFKKRYAEGYANEIKRRGVEVPVLRTFQQLSLGKNLEPTYA